MVSVQRTVLAEAKNGHRMLVLNKKTICKQIRKYYPHTRLSYDFAQTIACNSSHIISENYLTYTVKKKKIN